MTSDLQTYGDSVYRKLSEMLSDPGEAQSHGIEALGVGATAAMKASVLHLYIAAQLSLPDEKVTPDQVVHAWLQANAKFVEQVPGLFATALEQYKNAKANPQ